MWTRERPSVEGPRIKAFARVITSVLFIASFPVAVIHGATSWGWIAAGCGLVIGMFLLPSSLMRLVTLSGQVSADTGPRRLDSDKPERRRPRRDVSFAIVIGLTGGMAAMTIGRAFGEPGLPESWIWAGGWIWLGVHAVYRIDDWWQGWHVPEREAR